jgi:heterodisulfide reductase subunit B
MCQNNLEVKQPEQRRRLHIAREMPVVFLPQLMGLAFGAGPASLGLQHHVVRFPAGELVAQHEG